MTAIWMCPLASRFRFIWVPLGLVAGIFFHFGCSSSISRPEIGLGSLVCIDNARSEDLLPSHFPDQCPLLVVDVRKHENKVRVIGPSDKNFILDLAALVRIGEASLPGPLIGATDSLVERMVPGPNPGVLAHQSAFGLLFKASTGLIDTLFPEDLPAFQVAGGENLDLDACLDSLEAWPYYGFLQAPFAPKLDCHWGQGMAWKYAEDSGMIRFQVKSSNHAINLKIMDRSRPPFAFGKDWIFLQTVDNYWIWRIKGQKPGILAAGFMENSLVESMEAKDMDGDSYPELILRVRTDYGDGFYSSLRLLPGKRLSDTLRLGSLDLSGSSAEPGGSTMEAEWWIRSPWLYHAYAQMANDPKKGESHDIQVDAYRFSDQGNFRKVKSDSATWVFFHKATQKIEAQLWCDSLFLRMPQARLAGLRPLPRLSDHGMAWQPGVIAANAQEAGNFSAWDGSAKVPHYGRPGGVLPRFPE